MVKPKRDVIWKAADNSGLKLQSRRSYFGSRIFERKIVLLLGYDFSRAGPAPSPGTLAVIVPNDTDRQKLSTKFLKLCLLTSTPNYQCVTNF
jgi:hypothetical protein